MPVQKILITQEIRNGRNLRLFGQKLVLSQVLFLP